MYLKGEGTEADHRKAVELYELAAAEKHVRALNGLGYEYFHGHAVPHNLVSVLAWRRCISPLVPLRGMPFRRRWPRYPIWPRTHSLG